MEVGVTGKVWVLVDNRQFNITKGQYGLRDITARCSCFYELDLLAYQEMKFFVQTEPLPSLGISRHRWIVLK
jgi:hypothetical protein